MAVRDSKSGKKINMKAKGRLVPGKQWERAMKDEERADAIVGDIGLAIFLATIIEGTFPKRTKDVKKLMDNPNINMALKARLAYILGLIGETVQNDLLKIHEIRNKFGHDFKASFAHTEVLKLVKKLSTAKDQTVTAKNSHKLYEDAGKTCVDHIVAVCEKQQKAQKG